ncbi:hypothetical protein KUW18_10235 [Halomonas sp. DP5Y7-2]|uniref:hypothetical protein n=1 Tax=Halomonas sp. DP5Y7-2 TaxID=2859076 RepID=UPI001C98F2A2|nr:hypothetical protein [Halomonas sp. DP5Y7-2]MBY5984468.1 hypothetical protein [Halomonas sp. DP5Y7-2]
MKLIFKAVSDAPTRYSISGEILRAFKGDMCEEFDLTNFPVEGIFTTADTVDQTETVRDVTRDPSGRLVVTLLQAVIASQYPDKKAHWRESPTIDAEDYDPEICYVIPTGMAGVDDYEIVQGVDVAGNTGWTVRKKEMVDG